VIREMVSLLTRAPYTSAKCAAISPVVNPRADSDNTLWVDGLHVAEINGQPGALFFDPEGVLVVAVTLDIADGQVQTLRAVTNPDKLAHLQKTASRGLARTPNEETNAAPSRADRDLLPPS
jgi:hypothetical protein